MVPKAVSSGVCGSYSEACWSSGIDNIAGYGMMTILKETKGRQIKDVTS